MENIPKLNLNEVDGEQPKSTSNNTKTPTRRTLALTKEQRRAHYVLCEFAAISRNPIEGVYVTISANNQLEWFGLLIVRAGVFYGGIFQFTLTLPDDFPDTEKMPTVKFQDKLFHPLVDPSTNEVDFTRFFPSGWQRDRNHIYQILTATQGMFFSCKCEAGQAVNAEAAMLWKSDKERFKQLANDAVKQSRTQVYAPPESDDPRAIHFTPWNEQELEPIRLSLIDNKSTTSDRKMPLNVGIMGGSSSRRKGGYSWIDAERAYYMCDLLPRKAPSEKSSAERKNSIQSVSGGDTTSDELSGRSSSSNGS
jgi:ubiquitin-protein ligase